MWWKFRRHRLAVISGWFLVIMYGSILISEFIAPYNLHTRHADFIHFPPQQVHLFHDGRLIGPFVYGFDFALNLENLKREYTVEPQRDPPAALLLRGRQVQFLGADPHELPLRLPGRGRHPVPARHRPPRARSVLAHRLRRAHLAHRRPVRHHRELRARHPARRHVRLLRRLDRQPGPAHHRDDPLVPRAAAVDGALGRAAGHLGPDLDLLRHHHHPRPDRLDRARPRGALQAPGAARGGVRDRRGADGRAPAPHRPAPPGAVAS